MVGLSDQLILLSPDICKNKIITHTLYCFCQICGCATEFGSRSGKISRMRLRLSVGRVIRGQIVPGVSPFFKFDAVGFVAQSQIMQNDWASDNLRVIRTLMESSAVYRRALAPVMGLVGVTGIAAGALGVALNFETPRRFVVYWIAVALVCLAEAFLLIRRQAIKDLEPFWSPPTRRVAQAVSPAFLSGLAAGVAVFMLDATRREAVLLLIPIWMVLYGLAMHAAGFFMPRRFRMFAWGFVGCGLAILGYLICASKAQCLPPVFPFANGAMGVFFGGGHAVCGLYLYFTEKRGNVA
jgi:hypothetical protein